MIQEVEDNSFNNALKHKNQKTKASSRESRQAVKSKTKRRESNVLALNT